RLPFQRAVKPLVSAILRGPAWFNQLRHDAQVHPPDREGRQAGGGPRRGKGDAVVAADALRQAILAKHALEHAARAGGRRGREAVTRQDIARAAVENRQGGTPLPVAGPKVPFEMERPQESRSSDRRRGGGGCAGRGRARTAIHEPGAVQDRARGTERGSIPQRPVALQQLLRAPGRVWTPRGEGRADHGVWGGLG